MKKDEIIKDLEINMEEVNSRTMKVKKDLIGLEKLLKLLYSKMCPKCRKI